MKFDLFPQNSRFALFFVFFSFLSAGVQQQANASPLKQAILSGDLKQVQKLIENGTAIDEDDYQGYIPLHWAARNGHEKIVHFLISKGSNVNERSNLGVTPAHLAAYYGHVNTVDLLIKQKANIQLLTQDDQSVMTWAACGGHKSVMDLLSKQGEDISPTAKLFFATANGDMAEIKRQVEQKNSLNPRCKDGITPIFIAAQRGEHSMIQFFMSHGANIQTRVKLGQTILHYAGSLNVAELLTAQGLSPFARSQLGFFPIHSAAEKGLTDVVEYFLSLKLDPNIPTLIKMTPLHLAAEKGHIKTVELLVRSGASPNLRNIRGQTPLALARKNGHEDIEKLLTIDKN